MKTIVQFAGNTKLGWFKPVVILLTCVFFLTFYSCQKNEDNIFNQRYIEMPNSVLTSGLSSQECNGEMLNLYYGPKRFIRGFGKPEIKTQILKNMYFDCYDGNFVLKIRNGRDKRTRVSSAEIMIDGVLIVGPSDFSKHVTVISKPLTGLTPESVLTVILFSAPGSYIDLWIEGKVNVITPSFEQIGPLCQNSVAPILKSSSTNTPTITGKWNPKTIGTTTTGKTSYVFTPDEGQCATSVTMVIEITSSIIPVFTQIGPLLQNSNAPALPNTSNNGIIGSWNPGTINTSTVGTFSFIFTPSAGQCSSTTTLEIEVTNRGSVSDVEGNSYTTVKIGDQWWMAENLKTTRYSNGDLIGTTSPARKDIRDEGTPKYQWAYNGDETNVTSYGRLYTFYAVTDNRSVCPAGWHVSTDKDWTVLTEYLTNNGYGYEGSGTDIAKSLAANSGWIIDAVQGNVGNDQVSNNSSGFTALPSGYRLPEGSFYHLGDYSTWWCSSEYSTDLSWFRTFYSNLNYVARSQNYKNIGYSIRCVKDN